jgi:hypothetical protein
MSKMNDLEALERLCSLVESAGVDIAPNFDQYIEVAFGIANSVGEAGRTAFHRLCALCPKYEAEKADKLFTDAIAKGKGGNGLGSVFYLTEQAGVKLGELKSFSPFPTPPSSFSPESAQAQARTYYTFSQNGNFKTENYNEFSRKNGYFSPFSELSGHSLGKTYEATKGVTEEGSDELPYDSQYENLPHQFPAYTWPTFLQRIMDCSEGDAQRDMLFCGVTAALGATICPFTYTDYSKHNQYPNLQVFVIAPAASGKGAISWVRQLVMPFHKEKIARYEAAKVAYRKEVNEWANEGKKRDESLKPVPPRLELFFIAGNNSGTGIQENIIDNGGIGFIIEPEADVLASAIQAEYGQWSHLLRKAHDHEFLSYNRRKDHEYRECDLIRLSVLICGTPAQLTQLIPDAENGLFSRQLFYYMPPLPDFIDMFPQEDATSFTELFRDWSARWKKVVDAIQKSVSCIEFVPTLSQRKKMVNSMAQLFRHATVAHGDSMRSSVVRLAVNLLRIMNVVALLRALDHLLTMEDEKELDTKLRNMTRTLLDCPGILPGKGVPEENVRDGIVTKFRLTATDEDFDALVALAEPFYRHAEHALKSMPQEKAEERNMTPKEMFLGALPITFTRQEALTTAQDYALTEKQCEHLLDKLIEKGTLERKSRGVYSFTGDKRMPEKEKS